MNLRLDAAERAELNRLMMRLADGDRAAFQPIFAALWPRLRGWCVRLLRDVSAGEDAAQQTLLKVFAEADRFDPEGDVLTWGFTLATWECRTVKRRAARRADKQIPLEAQRDESPEQDVIHADLLQVLEDMMGELSPADQEILRMSRGEDASPQSSTHRKRRERALARLKRMWRCRHE